MSNLKATDVIYRESAKPLSLNNENTTLRPLVFIIEGDEEICTTLKLWLEIWKFDSLNIRNTDEAITLAKKTNPDFILLDISVSNSHTFETVRRMRNIPDLKNVAIILISKNVHFNSFSIFEGDEKLEILPINFSTLKSVLSEHLQKNNSQLEVL